MNQSKYDARVIFKGSNLNAMD